MAAYYNENDPFAAAWLRELIKAGLIADGEVDDRSIELVQPGDLRGFAQCHFFAGIGGWSYALRLASWDDARPVWTGSCPCQPFSAAGKGEGFNDSRHLWPAWFRLIHECRPGVVFGEQVSGSAGRAWLDHVSTDLEDADYTLGAIDLPVAGVGGFTIRQRLWWVADTRYPSGRTNHFSQFSMAQWHPIQSSGTEKTSEFRDGSEADELADSTRGRTQRLPAEGRQAVVDDTGGGEVGDVAVSECQRPEDQSDDGRDYRQASVNGEANHIRRTGAAIWADAQWLLCRDGKHRPVSPEPEIFPLASGVSNRVGLLRGAGNSICPQVAQVFIEAYMETIR